MVYHSANPLSSHWDFPLFLFRIQTGGYEYVVVHWFFTETAFFFKQTRLTLLVKTRRMLSTLPSKLQVCACAKGMLQKSSAKTHPESFMTIWAVVRRDVSCTGSTCVCVYLWFRFLLRFVLCEVAKVKIVSQKTVSRECKVFLIRRGFASLASQRGYGSHLSIQPMQDNLYSPFPKEGFRLCTKLLLPAHLSKPKC